MISRQKLSTRQHCQRKGLGRRLRPHRAPSARTRRGAAVVEFAIIAPLIFLFVFGIIEFGRLVMVQQVLTNASREGARRAVVRETTDADVRSTVEDMLDDSQIDGATVTVTTTLATPPDSADMKTVTIAIPFESVSWLPTPLFLNGTTLNASTTMRQEEIN